MISPLASEGTELSVQTGVPSSSVVSTWDPLVGWESLSPFSSCCFYPLPNSNPLLDRSKENGHTRSHLIDEVIT